MMARGRMLWHIGSRHTFALLCFFCVLNIVWLFLTEPLKLLNHTAFKDITLLFMLLNAQTLIFLIHIHAFQDDFSNGIALYIIANTPCVLRYITLRVADSLIKHVIPLALVSSLFYTYCEGDTEGSRAGLLLFYHAFQMTMILGLGFMMTLTLSLVFVNQRANTLLSYMMLLPLMVPSILVYTMDAHNPMDFSHTDRALLNLGFFMTFSAMLMYVMTKLYERAYEDASV